MNIAKCIYHKTKEILDAFINRVKNGTKIYWCRNHDVSKPGILGISFIEAHSKKEAQTLFDKHLIKRGHKPFAEFPYRIIDFGYANSAKQRMSDDFYQSIIWLS